MDEVVFKTSQKVDNLQHQLKIVANEGKNAVTQFSEKVKDATLHALENPKYTKILDAAETVIAIILKLSQESKEYVVTHYHPRILTRRVLKLLGKNFTKRDLLIGSAGVLSGIIVGFCLSYAIPRTNEMFRYMQAIQCLRYSGVEAAVLVEDAVGPKECGRKEVLVNVKAASVNIVDIQICNGYGALIRKIAKKYVKHCKEELPITLGRDCTGVVVDIGQNVSRLEIGDEVWLTAAFWAPGTMAQYVVASEDKVSHKPKMIGFEGAASLPYCGSIALSILQKTNINPQNAKMNRILVHGGCTATGCILLQILVAWGAKISTTCYKRAIPVAKALRVEDIIELSPLSSNTFNYRENNVTLLKEELRRREKFDVIITTEICELTTEELYNFCKIDGKVVSTLPPPLGSDSSAFLVRALYSLQVTISSYIQKIFTGRLNNFGEDYICYHKLEQLTELVENGKIQTVVDRVFQPHDIEDALNHVQSNESIGSTVITFR